MLLATTVCQETWWSVKAVLLMHGLHVYSVCAGSLCVHVEWFLGASGATEWLTSKQMLLHIDEATHLIINPSLRNHTNLCVCFSISPPLSKLCCCYCISFNCIDFSMNYLLKVSHRRTLLSVAVNLLCRKLKKTSF